MLDGPLLSEQEIAAYEDVVVPRYLSFFAALAAHMALPTTQASLAMLGCRSGFIEAMLCDKLGQGQLVGVDPSESAVAAVRAQDPPAQFQRHYEVAPLVPNPLPAGQFTHAAALHPVCNAAERGQLIGELRRLLAPGGQALLALPLRGSFPELADMVREYALKHDQADVSEAVDVAIASRPTPESYGEELENAGLVEVDVDVQLLSLAFEDGKSFWADPIAQLVVVPDLEVLLPVSESARATAVDYVRDAISKYWSEGAFELTVNVGCASARKPLD